MFNRITLDNANFSVADAEYLKNLGYKDKDLTGLYRNNGVKGVSKIVEPNSKPRLL